MMRMGRTILAIAALLALALGGAALAERVMRGSDAPPLPAGAKADRIVVRKSERTLTLYAGATALKTYPVAFGRGEPGPKRIEGDGKTPEGAYRISGRNPNSAYHLSLRVSYPEPRDVAAAQPLGAPPGGDIMIHGLKNGLGFIGALHRPFDWTHGCIAVTDGEMDEIWRAVPDGTVIEIAG